MKTLLKALMVGAALLITQIVQAEIITISEMQIGDRHVVFIGGHPSNPYTQKTLQALHRWGYQTLDSNKPVFTAARIRCVLAMNEEAETTVAVASCYTIHPARSFAISNSLVLGPRLKNAVAAEKAIASFDFGRVPILVSAVALAYDRYVRESPTPK